MIADILENVSDRTLVELYDENCIQAMTAKGDQVFTVVGQVELPDFPTAHWLMEFESDLGCDR